MLERRSMTQLSVAVQLVTRQFGGGVTPRCVDPGQWLRPAAVRGALRFFWRALFAHRFEDSRALLRAEAEIFGAAGRDGGVGPGRLSVCVRADPLGEESLCEWQPGRGDALAAAYFPAQSMQEQAAAKLLREGARADIVLSAGPPGRSLDQDQWKQVQAALTAFLVLGGSGARTRRGAGALACASMAEARRIGAPANLEELRKWLASLPRADGNIPCFSLAHREGFYLAPRGDASGEAAQRRLLALWRDVRQHRDHPESWDGAQGWGRTRWPEADAIRFIAGTHARWAGGVEHAPEERHQGRAPRAHLGLPIVFKFKDDRDQLGKERPDRGRLQRPDPDKVELVNRTGRYASPVLLSVVRVADQGPAAYHGLVLVTPSLLREEVVVRQHPDARLDPGPPEGALERIRDCLRAHRFERID